ncbi:hypothetical protein quinque_006739 [Culex quinquefasciatus]
MIRNLAPLALISLISSITSTLLPCDSFFCSTHELVIEPTERDYTPVDIHHRNGVTVLKFGRDPEPGREYPDLLPGTKNCGKYTVNRIRAGQQAALREFPWMAIIRYDKMVHPGCIGTLISKRYVLTAAQCARSDWKPYQVRLGEHTVGRDRDCSLKDAKDCAPPVRDYDIESIVEHWNHNASVNTNDTALLRLKSDVTFEDHIQPICLPTTKTLKNSKLEKYTISGWGWNEHYSTNTIIQKATIPLQDNSKCWISGAALDESHLCAGGTTSGGTCMGDIGVPLGGVTRIEGSGPRFVQFGIASRDMQSCGVPGTTIYTKVAYFMDWIRANMEP